MPRDAKRTFEAPPETFDRCPNGHELPNSEDGVDCSSALCALNAETPEVPPKAEGRTDAYEVAMDAKRLRFRRTLTQKLVPAPEGLEGTDAENYAAKKMVSLLVPAVQVLERHLLYGTDDEQRKASRDVLMANGYGPRDKAGQAANMIVINMGPGAEKPPLPYVGQVVEAVAKATKDAPKLPAPVP